LIIRCHQVIICAQKAKNLPSEFNKSEVDMNGHIVTVEWGYMLERELQMAEWEDHIPSLIPLYDWNTYHSSDFKLLWNQPYTDGGIIRSCSD